MTALGFYIFWILNWIFTLLPLRVLYLFSDMIFLLLYFFPSYRKKVVMKNLRKSFPEKTPEELKKIQRKFYSHLADMMIETLKMTHLSKAEMKRRYVVTNPELLKKYKDEGRDIAAVCGHYNNWEWMSGTPLYTDIKCVTIYRPMTSKLFERFMNHLRAKNGFSLSANSNIVRDIINNHSAGVNALYAFIADQVPPRSDIKYWTRFLNQDTPVYLGVEKIARKYNMAVLFVNNQKVRRGYYTATFEVLFDNPQSVPDHVITDAHVRRLEQIINERPEYWIWSHKRWKHKRTKVND
jgi:Kdo2-lipid IVA lauroyltransferase/acyltransferase